MHMRPADQCRTLAVQGRAVGAAAARAVAVAFIVAAAAALALAMNRARNGSPSGRLQAVSQSLSWAHFARRFCCLQKAVGQPVDPL